jgi:cell wall assembly regulator SMI1
MTLAQKLRTFLAERLPADAEPLAAGRARAEILQTLQPAGSAPPPDLVDFLSGADGQPDYPPLWFPPGRLGLLSAAAAVQLWRELQEYEDDEENESFFEETGDDGKVRALVYDRRRFPFAYNEGSTQYLFIDHIPGPNGVDGQVIFNPSEATFEAVADSFSAYIERVMTLVEQGTAKIVELSADEGGGHAFAGSDGHPLDVAAFRRKG